MNAPNTITEHMLLQQLVSHVLRDLKRLGYGKKSLWRYRTVCKHPISWIPMEPSTVLILLPSLYQLGAGRATGRRCCPSLQFLVARLCVGPPQAVQLCRPTAAVWRPYSLTSSI